MKIFNNIIIKSCYTNTEITLRKVCRVIRDNLENDSNIAALGIALGITKRSNSKDIGHAARILKRRLPYYAVTKIPSQDGSEIHEIVHIVCLVPTSSVGIYKVRIETDVKRFLHNLISDNSNHGKILKINSHVSIGADGKISDNCNVSYPSLLNDLSDSDISFRYKTRQLLFLKTKQLQKYPIFPIKEIVNNPPTHSEEMAYLFTIAHHNNRITLIYENTNNSRASYLFVVNEDYYNIAVEYIKKYFTSEYSYKRSSLINPCDFFGLDKGFIKLKRIIHDDEMNWQTTIEHFSLGIL